MALEALSTNELLNFIIYDTISTLQTPPNYKLYSNNNPPPPETALSGPEISGQAPPQQLGGGGGAASAMVKRCHHLPESSPENEADRPRQDVAVQGRKKRRRRPKVVKNEVEAESQRMTHITVERNRRKQMNEHLSVLKSLMPDSYVQRGDQASIVGGAIDYVKELEHLLQSLEAEKHLLLRATAPLPPPTTTTTSATAATANAEFLSAPFVQFFSYPQYTWSQIPNEYTSMNKAAAVADIEVTLIETHANIRVLSRKSPRQLSKMVAGFHSLSLSILHLNVTTLDHLVLYSISAKVEEGCQMSSADEIAGAVNHMLRIIEEEEANDHHHHHLFIHDQTNPNPSSY